ncbi:hypothetical protein RCL1_008714 [Eukaryota sp. TZLM3-RCL]
MPSIRLLLCRPPDAVLPVFLSTASSPSYSMFLASRLPLTIRQSLLESNITYTEFTENPVISFSNDNIKFIVDYLTAPSLPLHIATSLHCDGFLSRLGKTDQDSCIILENSPLIQRLLVSGWTKPGGNSFPGLFPIFFDFLRFHSITHKLPLTFSLILCSRTCDYDIVSGSPLTRCSKSRFNVPSFPILNYNSDEVNYLTTRIKKSSSSHCFLLFIVSSERNSFLFLSGLSSSLKQSPCSSWYAQTLSCISRILVSLNGSKTPLTTTKRVSKPDLTAVNFNTVTSILGRLNLESRNTCILAPIIDVYAYENENKAVLNNICRYRQKEKQEEDVVERPKFCVGRLFSELVT